jgi:predicted RNA methylase
MKLKHLESLLQQLDGFHEPKVELEQYQTSPHIAASILMSEEDAFRDKIVMDLGCGSGILTAGALFLGADFVTGIDVDPDALSICWDNLHHCFHCDDDDDCSDDGDGDAKQQLSADQLIMKKKKTGSTSARYDLLQADVSRVPDMFTGSCSKVDVVIMNPPFGTRNPGIDITFLMTALSLAEESVYSLHKSSTRDGIRRRCDKMNVDMQVLAELQFDLPATYKFHRKKSADIGVDFVRFCKQ